MIVKKRLKFFTILFVGILFFISSCNKDFYEDVGSTSKKDIISKRVSTKDLLVTQNSKLVKKIDELKKNMNRNQTGKYSYNDDYGFFIDEDNGIYLENDTLSSFTFPAFLNESDTLYVKDIVFNKNLKGDYDAYLFSYNILRSKLPILNEEDIDQVTFECNPIEDGKIGPRLCLETFELKLVNVPCENTQWDACYEWQWVLKSTFCPETGQGAGAGEVGGGIITAPYDSPHPTGGGSDPNLITFEKSCEKTKNDIDKANALLHHANVQNNMDVILKNKINIQSPNEWAVAIGTTNNIPQVTAPREGTDNQGGIPVSEVNGTYIGDGHSHPFGFSGDPSPGDFYAFLTSFQNHSNLKYRFVYGTSYDGDGNPQVEVYVLVLNDMDAVRDFLSKYPRSVHLNEITHKFYQESTIGADFYNAQDMYYVGNTSDSSDELYASGAVGMAYILNKFNVGVSIAKVDSNGDLKKINANIQEITTSSGQKKIGMKVAKCP